MQNRNIDPIPHLSFACLNLLCCPPPPPAVLQTYKVGVCFATSWLVLLAGKVPFAWTPYGLVSGLLMVPGGTAGYFGVRNAGLALSQGIWSSLKVLVAFAWGLCMFGEPVKSPMGTAVAVAFMLVGLCGMSYFASSSSSLLSLSSLPEMQDSTPTESEREDTMPLEEPLLVPDTEEADNLNLETSDASVLTFSPSTSKSFCGLGTRTLGILGAVIDGLYGGSVLVPMHFVKQPELQGLGFLLSFGIGCGTVVVVVWLIRWAVNAVQTQSCVQAWYELPSMHVTTVGPYALLAGLIWSIGNVCSILSVTLLGQGLGYSLVQSQLIVAGLWAVLFYGEIQGRAHIGGWFAFAILTLMSILLLTRQHESMPMQPSSSSESFSILS